MLCLSGRDLLISLSIKYNGDFDKQYIAIKNREKVTDESVSFANETLKKKGFNAITILDEDYPSCLKKVAKPPLVLYYKGNLALLNNKRKKFLDIGSTDYGINITKKLRKDYDIIYRRKSHGGRACTSINDELFIYEYLPNYHNVDSKTIFDVERIAVGLSDFLFIRNGKLDSACKIDVAWASQTNKNVYVLPHGIDEKDDVCNELLCDGWCDAVISAKDIVSKEKGE